ncbi:MAG: hypothetical protein IJ776_00790 [Paludibacteraceae bacterium]|nr:hypothetical protein [Paludibacteraceae bacterium]
MKRLFLSISLILSVAMVAMADSPLTSTVFWKVLNSAGEADRHPVLRTFDEYGWGDEVMAVLCSPSVPVEQRLCLVNYIGWDFDGQKHYADLVSYYVRKNGIESKQKVYDGMYGEQMIVFAYVKAMDNYFDVARAERIGREAVKRSPKSRAVNVIAALIKAQQLLDSDWAGVYKVCNNVVTDKSLNRDFSDEAVQAIMEYIGLYSEY